MGFRYAKADTVIDLSDASFTAIAVYSKMDTLTILSVEMTILTDWCKTVSGARNPTFVMFLPIVLQENGQPGLGIWEYLPIQDCILWMPIR